MGVYKNNFIRYGALSSNEQYLYYTEKDLKSYIQKCNDKYPLCIPESYHNFKNSDIMFEPREIVQNYVLLSEAWRCFHSYSLTEVHVKQILNPDENEVVFL